MNFHDPLLSEKIKPKIVDTALGIIEYAEFGKGFPVIVIHGTLGGYDYSTLLAQAVGQEDYRYIFISRPGYLGTPLSSGELPFEQAGLVVALLDRLNITKVGILAISSGCSCAIEFALVYPHRCCGLILVAPVVKKTKKHFPFRFKLLTIFSKLRWVNDNGLTRIAYNLKHSAKRSIRNPQIYRKTINNKLVWPLFSRYLESMHVNLRRRLAGTSNDFSVAQKITYDLNKLSVPLLVISGTEDRIVNYDLHISEIKKRLPDADIMTIEGGEHMAIFTHREVIKLRVSDFMETHFFDV